MSCPVDGCGAANLQEHARLVVEGASSEVAASLCAEIRNTLLGVNVLHRKHPLLMRLHALATALAEQARKKS